MKIETVTMGGVAVLRVKGDLDEKSVDTLRTSLFECISNGTFNVVINLSGMGYMSYMGLGVIVERLRKVRSFGGDIKLCGANMYTERLFRMVGVSALFDVHDTEKQAIAVFQEAA